MGVDLRVTGAEQMRALAADVRRMSPTLRRELYAALGRAAKPLGEQARANAAADLPSSGGLAGRISGSLRVRSQVRFGANPRVTLKAVAQSASGKAWAKARRADVRKARKRAKG